MLNIFPNVSLGDKTTFKIGGPAAWYAEPGSAADVQSALRFATEKNLPVAVMGKGSNLLVSDAGWKGLVINCEPGLKAISWNPPAVSVQGGVTLDTLVREAIERGLRGIEELSGIPGTVGGAVVMNAGAFSTAIAERFASAEVLDCATGLVRTFSREEMNFGYRTSALWGRTSVVLAASFLFEPGDESLLRQTRKDILEKRRAKQPLDLPNCGSVFKRPPGNYAGTLIEQAGLKGFRHGNVSISSKHANFIVNHGGGTAAEVRHLIAYAQRKVYELSNVVLEPEVIFLGGFDELLFAPGASR